MPNLTLVVVAVLTIAWPTLANAQIYAWRDARGTLVLSDRKLVDGADTYNVPGSPDLRVTRPVAAEGAYSRFEPLVLEHSARHSLRPDLVRAVIQVESGFNPMARSPKGAMGLMQLMPATAQELGVRNPYDPDDNIRGGTLYLRRLLDRYDGDEELALAAYNAGADAVDRHGRQVPPYRETRDYVRKVALRRQNAPAPETASKAIVYKTFELVGERLVPRYSSRRPAAGDYEVVSR